MDPIEVHRISAQAFSELVKTSRSPKIDLLGAEIAWYSNSGQTILGVIVLDHTDKDFASIMLGKDETGRFRAFNLLTSIATQADAERWLLQTIKWYTGIGKTVFRKRPTEPEKCGNQVSRSIFCGSRVLKS